MAVSCPAEFRPAEGAGPAGLSRISRQHEEGAFDRSILFLADRDRFLDLDREAMQGGQPVDVIGALRVASGSPELVGRGLAALDGEDEQPVGRKAALNAREHRIEIADIDENIARQREVVIRSVIEPI